LLYNADVFVNKRLCAVTSVIDIGKSELLCRLLIMLI